MQNKKTPLLYALICLSATLPMLSGCQFTGGPFYKTSSYNFYNPFSSKHKDDKTYTGNFNDPYGHGLPKQEVAPPPGGYLNDTSRETRTAANSRGRSGSDPINDLHHAGLAQNSSATSSSSIGIASSSPRPAEAMLVQTGNLNASNPTQPFGDYGTKTPIDSGFGATNGGLLTAQQSATPQSPNPNASFPANSGMPSQGQPGMDPDLGRPWVAGQTNPQNPMPNPTGFPGQQSNMTAATAGNSQSPYLNMPTDPVYGGNNAGTLGAPVSSPMVASTQGMGYGGQYHDAPFNNPTQGYPAQPATFQGTVTMPQNAVTPNQAMPGADPNAHFGQQPMPMQNGPMSNGQTIDGPGYGAMSGFGDPANSGMTNPAATGASAFPAFDASQATMPAYPQGTPTQTYPGQPNSPQQPANNGYQSGFNVFSSPTDSNDYRPGSTTSYGWQ